MSEQTSRIHPDEQTVLGALGTKTMQIAGAVGVAGLALSVVLGMMQGDHWARFFHSYLVSFCFFLTISLGALWFVILQHLTSSVWSVVIRRIAEHFMGALPVMAGLFLVLLVPILLGNDSLYFWTSAEAHHDHFVHAKLGYLNPIFFAIRVVVYFAAFILIGRYFANRSLEQDRTGDPDLSRRMTRAAGPSMVAFGFLVTFVDFDLLMSLHPAWYSTMFGVYFFAGCALSIFAVLALSGLALQRSGRLVHSVNVEHYHDVGKFLFTFVFFWGYVAFSQFMLIWYADIPEETIWYKYRMFTSWKSLSLLLLFGHFMVPFVLLMSRVTKRRLPVLAFFSLWLLAMHYCDLFWLVMPELNRDHLTFQLIDVTMFLGIGGIFLAAVARTARDSSLIALKDPRLPASLSFENY